VVKARRLTFFQSGLGNGGKGMGEDSRKNEYSIRTNRSTFEEWKIM
jgi:hypothetical protein